VTNRSHQHDNLCTVEETSEEEEVLCKFFHILQKQAKDKKKKDKKGKKSFDSPYMSNVETKE
jgi:hypothetical protein